MMVPHVADSPRRVDKTAVLRFSAHTLRINYGEFCHCLHLHIQQPAHHLKYMYQDSPLVPLNKLRRNIIIFAILCQFQCLEKPMKRVH